MQNGRQNLKTLVISGLSLCIALSVSCRGDGAINTNAQRVVRKAVGAGRWFPANPGQLKMMIADYIDQAQVSPLTGRLVAAIAPHAGYEYSGKVAGYVFRAIRDQAKKGDAPETIVILGFSHHAGFPGVALMDGDAISTPLGETPLDLEAARILVQSSPRIRMDYGPHDGEHSAENEVPFVQAALPDARLVIALIGDHDAQTMKELTSALNELTIKKRILVVASSDMLHDPDYDLVTKTDKKTLPSVAALDTKTLLDAWNYQHQIFCGIAGVVVAMDFAKARGCKDGTILYYRNTGDDFPESRGKWVVGYGAVVFISPGK